MKLSAESQQPPPPFLAPTIPVFLARRPAGRQGASGRAGSVPAEDGMAPAPSPKVASSPLTDSPPSTDPASGALSPSTPGTLIEEVIRIHRDYLGHQARIRGRFLEKQAILLGLRPAPMPSRTLPREEASAPNISPTKTASSAASPASSSPEASASATGNEKGPSRGQWVFNRKNAPWLWDHCPTYTLPSMPMMGFVDLMAQAAAGHSHGKVREIRDIKAFRWACPDRDGVLTLSFEVTPAPGQLPGDPEAFLVVLRKEKTAVARSIVILGVPVTEDLPFEDKKMAGEDMETVDDPYGRLFHGPAFQLLKTLKRGPGGAEASLDAGHRGGVPVGLLHPALLDSITHTMPHDHLDLWFEDAPPNHAAYPQHIPWLRLYGPTPTTGPVRCRVEPITLENHIVRFLIRVDTPGGAPWLAMELREFLLPLGRLVGMDYRARRPFLEERRFVPGVRLSLASEKGATLSQSDVAVSNWMPGTLESVYQSWQPLPDLTRSIAVKEHLASRTGLHPCVFDFDGHSVTSRHLPWSVIRPLVEIKGEEVTASDGVETLDVTAARDWWRNRLGHRAPWPGEILLFALARRFVRRVVLMDPEGLAACRERPALFKANRRTPLESLLFSALIPALMGTPVSDLARPEDASHGGIAPIGTLLESWPDGGFSPFWFSGEPSGPKGSMPALEDELAKGKTSLLVRAFSGTWNETVGQSGAVSLDAALKAGVPVIPVRFSGGMPTGDDDGQSRWDSSSYLPWDFGRQDFFIGSPLDAEELNRLPAGERVARAASAVDHLGPPLSEESLLPPEKDFAQEIEKQVDALSVQPVTAAILATLLMDPEATSLGENLLAEDSGGESREDRWIADLKRRIHEAGSFEEGK